MPRGSAVIRQTAAALWVLAVCLFSAAATAGARLEPAGTAVWRAGVEGFGSFSGLVVTAGGSRFVAVSDKGYVATGTLSRRLGRLSRVDLVRHGRLLDLDGVPVARFDIDAEGLAQTPDGRLWVSFEAEHRIWGYDAPFEAAQAALPPSPDHDRLQNNSAFEALASGPDGALFAIPERSGVLTRPFPVDRFLNGRWKRFAFVPRSGPWLVVGADVGPDGRLYVLERDFVMLRGFRTRIRRFALAPGPLKGEEVLLTTSFSALDNMEGISVWRDSDGAKRITLIADDNQSLLQRTLLAEYKVIEPPALRPRLRPRRARGGL